MNIKPHFIIDESGESKKLKKTFLKKFKIYSLKKSNVIIVFGGDGFMLHTLKKLRKNNKPFYGINTGTYGFLMNKPKTKELLKYISTYKYFLKGDIYSSISDNYIYNDVHFSRQGNEILSKIIWEEHIKNLNLIP